MQRGAILLTLFALLFTTPLLSYDDYWLKLLHFKDGKSDIDDPKFFLSKDGRYSPQSEFDATLKAIKDDKNISCKYPARVEYIFDKYPDLVKGVQKKECKALNELLSSISPKKAVVVFPTAHVNSPASMFGHTFLRIDANNTTTLMSNAINYSANTDEKNGLLFAYYGLTGGYEGRYSALPYYKKIKEYSNLESRDIWEYELNLSPKEIKRLLTHLYEIKDRYSNYYFFTKNCSYNLLWLLEVARPSLDLTKEFNYKAIPIDTIKAIKRANLIKNRHFRASQNRRFLALLKAKEDAKKDLKKAYEIEIEVAKLKLNAKAKKIDKKSYTKELIRLLKKRSLLPKTPHPKIKTPADPLSSHNSTRVSLGVGDRGYRFGFKMAFHDIYDNDRGFEEGAYIDFFNLKLRKKYHESLKLDSFDFVNINSYAPINELFKPISWGVSFGVDRFYNKTGFKLDGEIGFSFKIYDTLIATLLKPSLHLSNKKTLGIAPKVIVMKNFKDLKIGFLYHHEIYNNQKNREYSQLFSTFNLNKNIALNIKIEDDTIKKRVDASLFYYF